MNDDDLNKFRQTLDGIMGGSGEGPAKTETNLHFHGPVNINHGQQRDGFHAGTHSPALITEAQSGLLKGLVRKIGQAERANNPAYHDARIWTKANALVNVDHHRDIPKREFDRVKHYLEGWLRRLDGRG